MLRRAHGTGRNALVRVETAPADEAPDPVPGPPASPRGQGGRFLAGHAAQEASSGGKARAGQARLAASLGIGAMADDEAFAPYRRQAEAFRRHHVRELAALAGGHCGSGPSSMVASAALALGASRFIYDQAARGADVDGFAKAARLADQSRQALLTAYELAVREAQARPKAPRDPLAAWMTPKPTEPAK